jgi:hypothetical protein
MAESDAIEEAHRRVAELLLHPDDLSLRLAQLKTKFTTEKSSIDAILKTSVQSQLEDTQEGLAVLTNASDVRILYALLYSDHMRHTCRSSPMSRLASKPSTRFV